MAFFGMASKLASCTLAIMHRKIHPDGRVSGGPMYYLETRSGRNRSQAIGASICHPFCRVDNGGSLGGGNMFQVNQTVEILRYCGRRI